MTSDDDVQAELSQMDWQDVLLISEDPTDPRRQAAKKLIQEMVQPLATLMKAQSAGLRDLTKNLARTAAVSMPDARISTDVIKAAARIQLPTTLKISLPQMSKISIAMPRVEFGLDPAVFKGLGIASELREAARQSAELLQTWREQDWAAAGRIAETFVADTVNWPADVSPEAEEMVEALEPEIKEKDADAGVQMIMKNIVIVYLTILADRSIPDREQLYTLLVALIHLARALAN